jgi:hypothetical protein
MLEVNYNVLIICNCTLKIDPIIPSYMFWDKLIYSTKR